MLENGIAGNKPCHNPIRSTCLQVIHNPFNSIAGNECLATRCRNFQRYTRRTVHGIDIGMQIAVTESVHRNPSVSPILRIGYRETFATIQSLNILLQISEHLVLIFFQLHTLKSIDVTRNLLECNIQLRQLLFTNRADISINDIMVCSLRYYV